MVICRFIGNIHEIYSSVFTEQNNYYFVSTTLIKAGLLVHIIYILVDLHCQKCRPDENFIIIRPKILILKNISNNPHEVHYMCPYIGVTLA